MRLFAGIRSAFHNQNLFLPFVLVITALGSALFVYTVYSSGLPAKLLAYLSQSKSGIESSVPPVPKLSNADHAQFLTLLGKINALKVKLPASGDVSTRIQTHLEDLRLELTGNNDSLVDPKTPATTAGILRDRNGVIAEELNQLDKDLANGLEGLNAFEAAASEQDAINQIFTDTALTPNTTNPNTDTTTKPAQQENSDPIITCKFDHCGDFQLPQNECKVSVCCPIGDTWKWEKSTDICTDDQNAYAERKVTTNLFLNGLNFTRNCSANKAGLFTSLEQDYVNAAREWVCQSQCWETYKQALDKFNADFVILRSQGMPIPAINYPNNWSSCSNKCCGLDSNSDKYCPGARNSGNGYNYEGPTKAAESKTNGIGDEINNDINLYCE
ncbi:MAG: hypothetical protein NT141_02965 [candidate division WWE3 bacterium]|nr:hypothetical protein [candidate division WWE3 bacterium]